MYFGNLKLRKRYKIIKKTKKLNLKGCEKCYDFGFKNEKDQLMNLLFYLCNIIY